MFFFILFLGYHVSGVIIREQIDVIDDGRLCDERKPTIALSILNVQRCLADKDIAKNLIKTFVVYNDIIILMMMKLMQFT